jgi:hypothetical protein
MVSSDKVNRKRIKNMTDVHNVNRHTTGERLNVRSEEHSLKKT